MAEYDSFMFQSTLPTRGSDLGFVATYTDDDSVSIHAPHEGERLSASCIRALALNVSIHAPHEGERPWAAGNPDYALDVSIHAPHEGERRDRRFFKPLPVLCFNPRSPRGGATASGWHASQTQKRFNPRSPRGGATAYRFAQNAAKNMFQSTLPTRGSDGGKVHLYAAFPRIY